MLRVSNPAPLSSTTESVACTITSAFCQYPLAIPRRPIRPMQRRRWIRSRRDPCRRRPKQQSRNQRTPNANPSTGNEGIALIGT